MRRLKCHGDAVDKWGRPVKDEAGSPPGGAPRSLKESSGACETRPWKDAGNSPGCQRPVGRRSAATTPNCANVHPQRSTVSPKQLPHAAERTPRLGGFVFSALAIS